MMNNNSDLIGGFSGVTLRTCTRSTTERATSSTPIRRRTWTPWSTWTRSARASLTSWPTRRWTWASVSCANGPTSNACTTPIHISVEPICGRAALDAIPSSATCTITSTASAKSVRLPWKRFLLLPLLFLLL